MNKKNASIATIVGGALLAIGSFLAWVTVDIAGVISDSTSGMDGGDGWFTLIAGAVLVVLGYFMFAGRSFPAWLPWVALAVGAAVAIINYFDIQSTIDDAGIGSIGIGMYVMLAGVVVAIVGLVMGRGKADMA